MSTIIPVGYAQANVVQRLVGDNEDMVCTFGFDHSGSADDFVTQANLVLGAWVANILPLQGSNFSAVAVDYYVGQDGGPPAVFRSNAGGGSGSSPATTLPNNTAALIRKRTDAAGRRGRGRFYVPGLPEGEVNALGDLSTVQRNALQSGASEFLNDLIALDLPMVILHRTEGLGTEPPPTPVTSLVVELKVATQRRRLRP